MCVASVNCLILSITADANTSQMPYDYALNETWGGVEVNIAIVSCTSDSNSPPSLPLTHAHVQYNLKRLGTPPADRHSLFPPPPSHLPLRYWLPRPQLVLVHLHDQRHQPRPPHLYTHRRRRDGGPEQEADQDKQEQARGRELHRRRGKGHPRGSRRRVPGSKSARARAHDDDDNGSGSETRVWLRVVRRARRGRLTRAE